MPTYLTNMNLVKVLRLKQVGIAVAGLWLILLTAAVAGTIYQEIDGPTIRSSVAQNLDLAAINSDLNENLDSARQATLAANQTIDELNGYLAVFQIESANLKTTHAVLKNRFESFLSSAPIILIDPFNMPAMDSFLFP